MITTKQQMYALLRNNQLGNTLASYVTLTEWERSEEYSKYDYWGIRSLIPNGQFHANVYWAEVEEICEKLAPGSFNISIMIDPICTVTAWMNIIQSPDLTVSIMEYPPKGGNWSRLMPYHAIDYTGLRALQLLKKHLNSNSFDDLFELLDRYPEHVVELSATDVCLGTLSHRNAITWEVRKY